MPVFRYHGGMGNSLGTIIRELRKQRHLTQEALADGICSSVSVSRIENGTQMPSGATLEKLLERLGSSTYQICGVYYRNERQQRFEELADEAAKALTRGDVRYAKSMLDTIGGYAADDAAGWQVTEFLRGPVMLEEAAPGATAVLEQALACTKPGLDPCSFRRQLLTSTEANILSVLSVANYKEGKRSRAVLIARELLEALKGQQSKLRSYGLLRMNTAVNLAFYLIAEGNGRGALELAEETRAWALSDAELALMPELEFARARALASCGREAEARRIVGAIVPYLRLIGREQLAGQAQGFAETLSSPDGS